MKKQNTKDFVYTVFLDPNHQLVVGQKLDLTLNGKVLCKQTVVKVDGCCVHFKLPKMPNINWDSIFNVEPINSCSF